MKSERTVVVSCSVFLVSSRTPDTCPTLCAGNRRVGPGFSAGYPQYQQLCHTNWNDCRTRAGLRCYSWKDVTFEVDAVLVTIQKSKTDASIIVIGITSTSMCR